MTLADFTEPSLLVPGLLNEGRKSVISELSKRLKEASRVENVEAFARAVLMHESLVSTVFNGVAFSLARGRLATELSFAIGLSKYGAPWGPRRVSPVFTVVLFAIPDSAEEAYVSVIMTFSALLRDKIVFSMLRHSKKF